jgi:5-methylcytosine-specific restriction endonuclease McrA
MKCLICKKEITSSKGNKYCSLPCYWKSMKNKIPWNKQNRIEKECLFCKSIFSEREGLIHKRMFCSAKCKYEYRKGKSNKKRGGKVKSFCKQCGKEFIRWRYNVKNIYCCKDCSNKGVSNKLKGEKHWNWKGGISPRVLNTKEYREWRKSVFQRDHYTCQNCGYSKGRILEAHHILSWKDYPEKRFDINNGKTLCKDCHKLTKSFGKKSLSNK